ncbi:epoxide hydrolase family protein [Gryllotalpicola ginsengisoli]|uniref:epoxide hydrolase family protein n=1 Tax=Gryllotalpicola ginsengisoli TaxID=444608 RepID=UPI0003B3B316|nr:epoxide hydrolase family protein [Gryllotalpicola ginsengisoli]
MSDKQQLVTTGDTMTDAGAAVTPFTVRFDPAEIDELRARLSRTRWPVEPTGTGADWGMPAATVRAWADRWRDGFDFDAAQRRLNAFPQFTTQLEGQTMHFWHVRSSEPGALPLVLMHGWPATVLEFEHVVGLLTEPAAHGAPGAPAFHVVVPSAPGFGFGGPTTGLGWDAARHARVTAELMRRLGYARWGAAGKDIGALTGRELGALAPDGLVGVHLMQVFAFPTGDPGERARLTDADLASLSTGSTAEFRSKAGYQSIHQTRPQTLAYALEDSPAGLLAWNAELWSGFGEYAAYVDVDSYLTHLSVYWFTRTAGSAARSYRENSLTGAGYRDVPVSVPTAVAVFPQDFRTIRACVERSMNLVRYTEMPSGGHFAYQTDPELIVADLREFFAGL